MSKLNRYTCINIIICTNLLLYQYNATVLTCQYEELN